MPTERDGVVLQIGSRANFSQGFAELLNQNISADFKKFISSLWSVSMQFLKIFKNFQGLLLGFSNLGNLETGP